MSTATITSGCLQCTCRSKRPKQMASMLWYVHERHIELIARDGVAGIVDLEVSFEGPLGPNLQDYATMRH